MNKLEVITNLKNLTTITLPIPPTDNRLKMPIIRDRKPLLIKTSEYRDWDKKAQVHWRKWQRENAAFQPYEPTQGNQLEFAYSLFLPSWRTDIFNYNKAIADFLGGNKTNARLFTDDHYISLRLLLPVKVDKLNPRIEIHPVPL